ncbi:MAG: uracil-DNA glycosylase, partial [Candidatus Kapaibacterium sp.]
MSSSRLERYLEQQRILCGETAHVVPVMPAPVTAPLMPAPSPDGLVSPRSRVTEIVQPEEEIMRRTAHWSLATDLRELEPRICTCTNCALGATRTKFVFGTGNPDADIVVIGEAPGADEDASGEPFVGRAGQLLTKILEAVDLRREEVFICNIIKCRPPNNRTPLPEKVAECEPYLFKQLDIIRPAFILALGLTAVNTLTKNKFKMADVRGSFFPYRDSRMMVT